MVKMPRLPFDKFISAKRTLGTQMKATGEVMSICTNFEGGLMKAIRSLEQHVDCLLSYDFTGLTDSELREQLEKVDDMRIWRIAEALRRGISYEDIHEITRIDLWFIDKLAILVEMEQALKAVGEGKAGLTAELLAEAKRIEFPDNVIARLTGIAHSTWLTPARLSLQLRRRITIPVSEASTRQKRQKGVKRCWSLDPAPSVSGRGLNLTSVPCTAPGRSAGKVMRPLS